MTDKPPASSDQVRLAEIALGEKKLHERHKTIRLISCGTFGVVALGMIVVAVVRLADPPWVKLLIAVFGPSGAVVAIGKLYLMALKRKERQANLAAAEGVKALEKPAEDHGGADGTKVSEGVK